MSFLEWGWFLGFHRQFSFARRRGLLRVQHGKETGVEGMKEKRNDVEDSKVVHKNNKDQLRIQEPKVKASFKRGTLYQSSDK